MYEIPRSMCELHSRATYGIDVRLLWSEDDGHVEVAVVDGRSGESFALEVRDGDRALHVFQHPFAYAAARGIELGPALEADPLAV